MAETERRHTRVPRIDPEKWDEQPVFRETFMKYVCRPKHDAAFRSFSQTLYTLALEGGGLLWDDTYAEAEAERLRAVVADLRHLEGCLKCGFEAELEDQEEDENHMTPRKKRLWRFSGALSKEIAALADRVEREIQESLQDDDDETEIRRGW